MVFVGKDVNPLSAGVLQFFPLGLNIDMRLKMLPVRRFIMEHQFIVVKEDVVTVILKGFPKFQFESVKSFQ